MSDAPLPAPDFEADLLVVGGGMVGMTFAVAAASAGLTVIALEREDPAKLLDAGFDGRVSAIAAGSRRAFEGIGLWNHVLAQGNVAEPIRDIRVSDGDSLAFVHYDSRALARADSFSTILRGSRAQAHDAHHDVEAESFGHIVENRVIRAALAARLKELPAITRLAPAMLADVVNEPACAVARLTDGRRIHARLVVSAEGRDSSLRAARGIAVTRWSYPQTAIVCTIAHERPHGGVAHERFLPVGPFAILPMTDEATRHGVKGAGPRHRSSLVWTEKTALASTYLSLNKADFDGEIARRVGDFLGTVESIGPRWSYPLSLLHAERYADERLALIGDAAHAIHPIAGQGLNLGLRDVAALAEVLVDARRLGLDIGFGEVLARYERWRRFDNVLLAGITDGLNRLFSNSFVPFVIGRRLGFRAVNRAGPLKKFFMRHAMGLVGDLPRLSRGEPL
ncbi:MAG TPA: UbiH/UbiF/VisC/COQ6 family ubiquinone biosynthesis hydroxylase [Alphaproteobacteria bacterium]|jgi:2-octaprenyl-6-methoxyphenol hydroxylase